MRRTTRRLALLALPLAFGLATVTPASAHEDEESVEAGVLVRQAIALIVNTPRDEMAIKDKIGDALGSEKPEGVDLALVEQASAELDRGDLHRVRALLEVSVGAMPHMSGMVVRPILETAGPPATNETARALRLATGEETGTDVAIDGLDARRTFDAGTWTALSAFAVVAAAGLALSVRFRPPVPLHALKNDGRS